MPGKEQVYTMHREKEMATIELGTRAPGFALDDCQGNRVPLDGFLGQAWVLLVFNRGFF